MPAPFDTTKLFKGKKGKKSPAKAAFDFLKGPALGGTGFMGGIGDLLGKLPAGADGQGFDWQKALFGQDPRLQQASVLTPEQQQYQSQGLSQAMQMLKNPTAGFEPIEQQARTGFSQQTVPTLAEMFTGMSGSGGGALSSPALMSRLSQAGSGLEQGLGAMKAQYGQNAIGQGSNLFGMGMRPGLENILFPGSMGLLGGFGQSAAQGAGSMMPMLMMKMMMGI